MNAGSSYPKAIEWAQANSLLDGEPRYVSEWGGRYWISREAPRGAMAWSYSVVTSDGAIHLRQPSIEETSLLP